MKIEYAYWQVVYQTNGNPTLMCLIYGEDGSCASAIGKTNEGVNETYELLLESALRFNRYVAPILSECDDPLSFDEFLESLDLTCYHSSGINAASIACYRWYAHVCGVPLYELYAYVAGNDCFSIPSPFFTVDRITQAHAAIELFIIPIEAHSCAESLRIAVGIHHELQEYTQKTRSTRAISSKSALRKKIEKSLFRLTSALEAAHQKYDRHCAVGINMHAHQNCSSTADTYYFTNTSFQGSDLIDCYLSLMKQYPIMAWHNPLALEDTEAWKLCDAYLRSSLKQDGLQIGITALNSTTEHTPNTHFGVDALLFDVSQEMTTRRLLQKLHAYQTLGKRITLNCHTHTESDDWIIDMAVGMSVDQIMFDTVFSSNNFSICNRLLVIERELLA